MTDSFFTPSPLRHQRSGLTLSFNLASGGSMYSSIDSAVERVAPVPMAHGHLMGGYHANLYLTKERSDPTASP